MRATGILGIALASSGCLIVPRTVHSTAFVASEQQAVVPPQRAAMSVELSSVGGMIFVRALAPRVCTRETWDTLDVRRDKEADLELDLPNDGYGALAALLFAPVTLAVSGLVTGIIVASSDATVTRERKKVASTPYECPVLGVDLPVVLTLPSGGSVELRTDARGEARYEVAPTDVDRGTIGVQVGELAPRVVQYCRGACPPGGVLPVAAEPLPAPTR